VKRFNVSKFQKMLALLVVCVIAMLVWPIGDILSTNDDVHTRRFCAYGQVYVEFEHNGNVWGTTFLSKDGRLVPCDDDDTLPEPTNNRVNI